MKLIALALLAAVPLTACASAKVTCVRKDDGKVFTGNAINGPFDGDRFSRFEVAADDGLIGRIDASNARNFTCKVTR